MDKCTLILSSEIKISCLFLKRMSGEDYKQPRPRLSVEDLREMNPAPELFFMAGLVSLIFNKSFLGRRLKPT